MSTRDYRSRKIEYYGRTMGPLNLYIYLLLPAFVLYSAVTFTWCATVSGAGFDTPIEFLMDLALLILSVAALISISGVDKYAFYTNVFFLLCLAGSTVARTFFPTVLDGSAFAAGQAAAVMGDGAGMAAGELEMASAGMEMAASAGGMDMMGGAMGGMGGGVPTTSLLAKILAKFIKTGDDITLFANTLECEIFVLICLLLIAFFISNRRFFFSSLKDFRARDEIV